MAKLYNLLSTLLYWLALISLTMLLLSQLLGRVVWQLELFSHYVPHVAILTLLAAIVDPRRAKSSDLYASPLHSRLVRSAFFIIATLLLGWCLTPLSLIAPTLSTPKLSAAQSDTISIAYQNVNIANNAPEQTLKQLTQADPDVLVLIEAGGAVWQPSIEQLATRYDIHCGVNDTSPFAMQVFLATKTIGSKGSADNSIDANALSRCEILELADYPMAKVYLADGRVIYAAHPPPPINRRLAQDRNRYLTELAILVREDKASSILVVGDFNLSGFSPIYRDFMRQSRQESSQNSNQNNRPLNRVTLTGLPTWLPFGIGIDQILVKGDWQKVTSKPLGWQGSDHRGFLIGLN